MVWKNESRKGRCSIFYRQSGWLRSLVFRRSDNRSTALDWSLLAVDKSLCSVRVELESSVDGLLRALNVDRSLDVNRSLDNDWFWGWRWSRDFSVNVDNGWFGNDWGGLANGLGSVHHHVEHEDFVAAVTAHQHQWKHHVAADSGLGRLRLHGQHEDEKTVIVGDVCIISKEKGEEHVEAVSEALLSFQAAGH